MAETINVQCGVTCSTCGGCTGHPMPGGGSVCHPACSCREDDIPARGTERTCEPCVYCGSKGTEVVGEGKIWTCGTHEHRGYSKVRTRECHEADNKQVTAYIMQYGESPEANAAQVLYRFMCCEAGRNLVEFGILRPFGYTMTRREGEDTTPGGDA